MAFLDSAEFCGLELYENNRHSRVSERNLELGGLYTYMMLLDAQSPLAAHQTARVESVSEVTGLISVKFAFLDGDLIPEIYSSETIQDGYIDIESDATFEDCETKECHKIREGYLRDYFEGQFIDILQANHNLELVSY